MEKKHQKILLERLKELRHNKDKVDRQIENHKNIIWEYTQMNWPHDKDYLKTQKELSALELEFKNLIEQMRPLQNQYYHKEDLNENKNNNQTPIEVFNKIDDQYEIPTGLLGVNRDIFNKLGTHRWADDRDLQQMYGISQRTVP
jgi:hypothetical protein